MNIALKVNQYSIHNTYLLEKKNNVIVEGTFSKILYSNQFFTMNGVYFYLPLQEIELKTHLNGIFLQFHPYQENNLRVIQELVRIEYNLLDYYRRQNHSNKKISNILSKQLYSGCMKIYRDLRRQSTDLASVGNIHYIIKISGIWETVDEVGLAIKLVVASHNGD
jgi:hypothetical protein